VEGTILYYLKGFGTPFLLLPALWLVIVAKRDKLWQPLYPVALGGFAFFFFSLSLNSVWEERALPLVLSVLVGFAYFCLYIFYISIWFGSYTMYDPKWFQGGFRIGEVYFDYVARTFHKYNIPQCLIVGVALAPIAWCVFSPAPQRFSQVGIIVVGLMAATGLLTYASDRNRAEDIRRHFVMKKLAGRKLKKRTTLLIAGTLLVLGTLFEIPRGFWLAWLVHVFFIVAWLLIHFRYWRSVYG
jgi:hypothetical protein